MIPDMSRPSLALPRVVLLCGEDPDLKQEAIQGLKHQAAKLGALDWETLAGSTRELPALLNEAGTPGLFSSLTVRVVQEADRYFKRGISQESVSLLRRFSEQASPPACVVLVTSLKPKAAEALGVGRVTACWPLEDREGRPELTRWTQARARALGKSLDAEACVALLSRTGNALSRISDALATLSIYVGARPSIAAADVEALVGSDPQGHAFALAEATALGEGAKSLRLLRLRLESGEAGAGICAVLAFHWRRLAQALARMEAGSPPAAAAESVGVRYPFQAPFLRALGRLSPADAALALGILRDADRRLKGGGGAGRAALERALPRLCALGARAGSLRPRPASC